MRITKKGTAPSERLWSGKCHNCGSEAEAVGSEMTHVTEDQRENRPFSWEICPVCNAGSAGNGYGGMLFHPVIIQ